MMALEIQQLTPIYGSALGAEKYESFSQLKVRDDKPLFPTKRVNAVTKGIKTWPS